MKHLSTLFFILFWITAGCGTAAGQVIIQSFEDAMRSDMYEPPYVDKRVFPGNASASSNNRDKDLNGGGAENYNKKIAARLFNWDLSEKPYADIFLTRKKQEYKVASGQTVNIIIRANPKSFWLFDKNSKLLEHLSTKKGNAGLMISFRVKSAGKEKLFFDSIQKDGDKIKVLESRILVLIAEDRS